MDIATITGILSLLTFIVLVLCGVVLYLSVKMVSLRNIVIKMNKVKYSDKHSSFKEGGM